MLLLRRHLADWSPLRTVEQQRVHRPAAISAEMHNRRRVAPPIGQKAELKAALTNFLRFLHDFRNFADFRDGWGRVAP